MLKHDVMFEISIAFFLSLSDTSFLSVIDAMFLTFMTINLRPQILAKRRSLLLNNFLSVIVYMT